MKFNRKWIIAAIVVGLIFVALSAFNKEGYEMNDAQRMELNKNFNEPDTRLNTREQEIILKAVSGMTPGNPNPPPVLVPLLMEIFKKYPNLPQKMRRVLEMGNKKDDMKQLINFQCDMKMAGGAFACYPQR